MRSVPPHAPATILLAEDEGEVRQFLATLLRGVGYEVLEAGNGQLALLAAAVHPGPIHLLLADVAMPVMPGTELARQLAAPRPALRVSFISGYSDPAAAAEIQAWPGAEFLRKPFTAEELLAKVQKLLS